MGAMNPFNVQNHFRIRSDTNSADGGTPTWQTTEDQANSPTSSLTWATATTFRIRFVVSNTGSAISNSDFQLFVSKNGGSYAAITTGSSNVQAADAGSDADATVLQSANYVLTAGSGTAANGEYSEDGIVSSNITDGTYMEVEFGLTIVDADVSNNDTLDFRVYYNGATMDSYSITPRITVNKSTTVTGTGVINTTVATLSGSGIVGRSGSGAINTTIPTLSGAGAMGRSGSGAINTTLPALAGTGNVGGAGSVTGSGAITATVPTLSATGEITKTATGAISTPVPTLASAGTITKTATGAITTTTPTLNSSGTVTKTGSGAISTPTATLNGSGTIYKTGTGSILTLVPTLAGSGNMGRSGTGAITALLPTLNGTGSINGAPGGGSGKHRIPTIARRRRRA